MVQSSRAGPPTTRQSSATVLFASVGFQHNQHRSQATCICCVHKVDLHKVAYGNYRLRQFPNATDRRTETRTTQLEYAPLSSSFSKDQFGHDRTWTFGRTYNIPNPKVAQLWDVHLCLACCPGWRPQKRETIHVCH